MFVGKNLARLADFFYLVARGGKVPLLTLHKTKVAGQMGRLGHDNREESGCARS